MGIRTEGKACVVLNAPDRMVPWSVPCRTQTITQLSNWVDYGFNIWPDRSNRPHLVIGEAVSRIACIQGRWHELASFMSRAAEHFESVHILELAEGCLYGSPTNSIDVGRSILSNSSFSDAGRSHLESVLRRSIDTSIDFRENAPGFRCAVFPVDKSAYSLLVEGDPLHHIGLECGSIDPWDPLDAFFDVKGAEHERLFSILSARRKKLRDASVSMYYELSKRHSSNAS